LIVGIVVHRGDVLGLEHPLLRYGAAPPIEYSSMNGFGHHLAPSTWFMALWSLVGCVFLLIAAARWRGKFKTTTFGRRVAVALTIAAAAVAAFIFYNTNVLNRYESASATLAWKADYERKYGALASLPTPRVVGLTSEVDLFPKERR